MPVEIKELLIRATVSSDAKGGSGSVADGSSGDKEAIVTSCVDEVLRIIEHTKER